MGSDKNKQTGSEQSTCCSCRWCPEWIRNFNVYFPLGLLGFFLFWGAILAKLYLPSSVWGSDHVSSSKSQVSRHIVEVVTPVKTTLPPTQTLPHHPQARIQPVKADAGETSQFSAVSSTESSPCSAK